MVKKFIILLLTLSLCGCSIITNAIPSTLSIKGRVLINDKLTAEDFMIEVYRENTDEAIINSEIEENGDFEVEIHEDGNYTMEVVNRDGSKYKTNPISFTVKDSKLTSKVKFKFIVTEQVVEQTSSINVDSPAVIKGIVTYPNEVDRLEIKVIFTDKEGGKAIRVFMVNESGEFEISDIQDGVYYLVAQGPNDLKSQWLKVEVVNGKVSPEEGINLKFE